MILFVCETQTQIFNALNIKYSLYTKEKADICISKNIYNVDEIVERLKSKSLFSGVFTYMPYSNTVQSLKAKIEKILIGLHMLEIVKEALPNRNKEYSSIFLGGPSIFTQGIYYYFKRKNADIKLRIYEEGIFEYYMFKYKKNFTRRIYSRLIYDHFYLDECEKVFIYKPELLLSKPDSVEAVKIPDLSNVSEVFKNLLNYVFGFKEDGLEGLDECEYIYLDQAFSLKEDLLQREIVKHIISQIGVQDFLIKLHPFSQKNKYDEMNVRCIKSSFPLELIQMNYMKENITFLTVCSSAVFNSNLVLGKQYKIVLLYKIFDSIILDEGVCTFINKFLKLYPKELVSIPIGLDDISL